MNNTIVNCGRAFRFFDHFDRHDAPYCLTPGSGRATIINCIVWDCPQSIVLTDSPDGNSYANVAYCDIEGGPASASVSANSLLVWGPGNLNVDPQFTELAALNFHLTPGSPCIDAGTNLSALVTNDFDGHPRPLDGDGTNGAAFDLGAYEYLLATADSNGDGIPDGWCQQYSFSPTDASVASGNPDQDPYTTLEEWIADTDPTDALSWFRIAAISNAPPLMVSFSSSSNRQYTLVASAELPGGGWTNVPGQAGIPGIGGRQVLTDTNIAPGKFYRVSVKVP